MQQACSPEIVAVAAVVSLAVGSGHSYLDVDVPRATG